MSAVLHPDGLPRCPWPKQDPLYVAYHDEEWGVPEYDDRALYEKLILDGFQAGLSWITILRKRENFRRAFDGFEPRKIARYTPRRVERLMQDAGIVRNRMKIEGAILSARAWLEVMEKGPGFSPLLWDFVDGEPQVNRFRSTSQVPAETAGLRVSVLPGGCSGFKYSLNIEERPLEDDMVAEINGVRVFVDGFSAQYLTGVTIDYVSSMQGSGFTFNNPNATGGCGCGSSFTA